MNTNIAEFANRIQPILSASVSKSQEPRDRIPFLIASVANKDKVLFLGSDGLKRIDDEALKIADDSVFHHFSSSKSITSTLLFILIEKGLIDSIDDLVEKYLPDMTEIKVLNGFEGDTPILVEPKNKPTLKNLVTHTAGFAYYFGNKNLEKWIELHDGHPNIFLGKWEEFKYPMVYQPGTSWEYSCAMDWAGRVIQVVSGKSLEDFMQENIFKPLGMNSTSFYRDEALIKRQGKIHVRNEETGELTVSPELLPFKPEFCCGGMGLVGTCSDYLKFLQIFLNKGSSPDGVEILKPEVVENYFLKDQLVDELAGLKVSPLVWTSPQIEHDPENPPEFSWTVAWCMMKEPLASGRGAPSFNWSGMANTYYWVDIQKGIVGYFATSISTFGDPAAANAYKKFEKATYAALAEYNAKS